MVQRDKGLLGQKLDEVLDGRTELSSAGGEAKLREVGYQGSAQHPRRVGESCRFAVDLEMRLLLGCLGPGVTTTAAP